MSKIDTVKLNSNLILTQTFTGTANAGTVSMSRSGRCYCAMTAANRDLYYARDGEVPWGLYQTLAGVGAGTGFLSMSPNGDIILEAGGATGIQVLKWNPATLVYDLVTYDPMLTIGGWTGASYQNTTIGSNGLFAVVTAYHATSGGKIAYTTDITANPVTWLLGTGGTNTFTYNIGCTSTGSYIMTGGAKLFRIPHPSTPTNYNTSLDMGGGSNAAVSDTGSYEIDVSGNVCNKWVSWASHGAVVSALPNYPQCARCIGGTQFVFASQGTTAGKTGAWFCYPDPSVAANWHLLTDTACYEIHASYNCKRFIVLESGKFLVYDRPSLPATGQAFYAHSTTLKSIGPTAIITKYSA